MRDCTGHAIVSDRVALISAVNEARWHNRNINFFESDVDGNSYSVYATGDGIFPLDGKARKRIVQEGFSSGVGSMHGNCSILQSPANTPKTKEQSVDFVPQIPPPLPPGPPPTEMSGTSGDRDFQLYEYQTDYVYSGVRMDRRQPQSSHMRKLMGIDNDEQGEVEEDLDHDIHTSYAKKRLTLMHDTQLYNDWHDKYGTP